MGRRHLSPLVSGLVVSPATWFLALLGFITELRVVPAEGVLGLQRVGGGGAVSAAIPGETAVSARAVCSEGGNEFSEACHFRS